MKAQFKFRNDLISLFELASFRFLWAYNELNFMFRESVNVRLLDKFGSEIPEIVFIFTKY